MIVFMDSSSATEEFSKCVDWCIEIGLADGVVDIADTENNVAKLIGIVKRNETLLVQNFKCISGDSSELMEVLKVLYELNVTILDDETKAKVVGDGYINLMLALETYDSNDIQKSIIKKIGF